MLGILKKTSGTPIINLVKLKQSIQSLKKKILNFPDFTCYVESFIFYSQLFILDLPSNVNHIFEKSMQN